jgi:triosephosphate isomerase
MVEQYILGNWKMHGLRAEAQALAQAIAANPAPAHVNTVLFPPFTALGTVAPLLTGARVALGAQDCSPEPKGAFTGDVSAEMLKDAGCAYVILGHSERRALHGESDALVQSKALAAMAAGLIPVICVGENGQQREQGDYLEVICNQVARSVPAGTGATSCIIAYEPVWAIGSGNTPTPEQISEVHKSIASALTCATSGARTPIVYGGSVKAACAGEILCANGVDGVLVGGASLKAEEFCAIIAAARKK